MENWEARAIKANLRIIHLTAQYEKRKRCLESTTKIKIHRLQTKSKIGKLADKYFGKQISSKWDITKSNWCWVKYDCKCWVE